MLHWKHIKGINGTDNSATLFTFLEFQHGTIDEQNLYLKSPVIYVNSNNNTDTPTQYRLGNIVCNEIINKFTAEQDFSAITFLDSQNTNINGYISSVNVSGSDILLFLGYVPLVLRSNEYVTIEDSDGYHLLESATKKLKILDNHSDKTIPTENDASILFEGMPYFKKDVGVKNNIIIENECRSLFFNATSDIRAKQDLQILPQGMLDIVNHMQVYTYTYKNNLKRSIGLIAQDIEELTIDGFSFVDNKEASGENNDFMAIKESKIVYILLGAIQELSKEVNELKQQLKDKEE